MSRKNNQMKGFQEPWRNKSGAFQTLAHTLFFLLLDVLRNKVPYFQRKYIYFMGTSSLYKARFVPVFAKSSHSRFASFLYLQGLFVRPFPKSVKALPCVGRILICSYSTFVNFRDFIPPPSRKDRTLCRQYVEVNEPVQRESKPLLVKNGIAGMGLACKTFDHSKGEHDPNQGKKKQEIRTD